MIELSESSREDSVNGASAAIIKKFSTSMQKFSMQFQIKQVPINTGHSVLNILYH